MSQYLVLIYDSEAAWADAGPEDVERIHQAHVRFGERNAAVDPRRQRAAADQHRRPRCAATPPGGLTVTDGAVRRDQGGARRLLPHRGRRPRRGDRLAKQVPAPFGGVEVRPIMVFD